MSATPEIHARFSITSGCLCYGWIQDIWQGASVPPSVRSMPATRSVPGGTVRQFAFDYNIPAEKGVWNSYQLQDLETKKVAAWFLAHAAIDPQAEIVKILRIAGSPYEFDGGSSVNDDKTSAAGVFVIGRYDWCGYARRPLPADDPFGGEPEPDENDERGHSESLGIIDYDDAKAQALRWKEQRRSQREDTPSGTWLHIPDSEYNFGRFGFNDDHTMARSFLYFTTYTNFERTAFMGLEQPLRMPETHEERFERRLREGFNFSGVETLQSIASAPSDLSPPPPPESEQLGFYDRSEHIFTVGDIDVLRVYRTARRPWIVNGLDINAELQRRPISEFIEPWTGPTLDLLNELVLSYVERAILPVLGNSSGRTVTEVAERFAPRHADPRPPRSSMDKHLHQYFTQPESDPIPDFDDRVVAARVKQFMERRLRGREGGDSFGAVGDDCVAGSCRMLAFLVTEILELANNSSKDNWRVKIVPYDIRISVYNDPALFAALSYSKAYWVEETR